jgi:hypothetical protein
MATRRMKIAGGGRLSPIYLSLYCTLETIGGWQIGPEPNGLVIAWRND